MANEAREQNPPIIGLVALVVSFLLPQVLVPEDKKPLRFFLFMALFVAAMFAIVKTKKRYLVVIDNVLGRILTPFFLVWLVAVLMIPAGVVYWASKWLSEGAPRWGQGIVLSVSALLLLYLLQEIFVPGGRERFFERCQKAGPLVPLAIAVNLLFACVGLFSTFVLVLPANDTFFIGNPHPAHGKVADLFLWHFFKMIPLFDVNETIHWKAPLEYQSKAVGWILVLFKRAVALPVLWLIGAYYADRKKSEASAKRHVSSAGTRFERRHRLAGKF